MDNCFINYESDDVYNTKMDNDKKFYEEFVDAKLARAYVPFQKADKIYSPEKAFNRGTVFPELDQPRF